jgi:hypothetical protein
MMFYKNIKGRTIEIQDEVRLKNIFDKLGIKLIKND